MRRCIALLMGLAAMTAAATLPAQASATAFTYCSVGAPGQAPGNVCGPGPRHSLTYSATTVTAFSHGYVCARSQNDDGSYTAYYCGNDFAQAGPYCGCVLRKGWDLNNSGTFLTMDGIEYY